MKQFIYFLCLFFQLGLLPLWGQTKSGTDFYGTGKDIKGWEQSASYLQDKDVAQLITTMLSKNGILNRFIIQSTAMVENCQAVLKEGKPYILYNPQFLNRVKSLNFSTATLPRTNDQDWYALSILAHELGHHVNNHLNNPPPDLTQRDLELEADEFSGYMLQLMGASLSQAQLSYLDIPTEGGYTHPPRRQRLDAVARGYNKAKEQNKVSIKEKIVNMDDRDNDGLANSIDKCPDQYGTLDNRGCPETKPTAETYTENTLDLGLIMHRIRGGNFTMGSDEGETDEKPPHEVTVSDFYMGTQEVTLAQFKKFIDDTGYKTDAEKEGYSWKYTTEWVKMEGINWRHDAAGNIQTDNRHPVIHISWNDAQAYCKWVSQKTGRSYRLPTEAEWEYAAGNGSRHTKYAWGNGNPTKSSGGNVADETKSPTGSSWATKFEGYTDGYWFTAPVGQFGANDFGLYDMTGNVWEWCSDWYGSDYYTNSPRTNPQGASSGSYRVIRGGSWLYSPQYCRVADRGSLTPGNRDYFIGFRLVASQ